MTFYCTDIDVQSPALFVPLQDVSSKNYDSRTYMPEKRSGSCPGLRLVKDTAFWPTIVQVNTVADALYDYVLGRFEEI